MSKRIKIDKDMQSKLKSRQGKSEERINNINDSVSSARSSRDNLQNVYALKGLLGKLEACESSIMNKNDTATSYRNTREASIEEVIDIDEKIEYTVK